MKKLVTAALCLLVNTAFCQSAGEELQAKLNALRTMSANFNQVVKAGKREVSETSGVMALSRPGKFRWETKDPMEQLVVADSNRLWVYDVDLEQVTVKKQQNGLGGTAGLFLSGYDNTVTRDFEVSADANGKKTSYDLKAKSPKENFQKVKLIFNGDKLTNIELFDQLGQHTSVQLSNIKNNPSLSASLFQFKPPKGVDVVEQ
ncbi:outer membrane lipoprotein carrier protein [Legionella birminghamensis]|uniref:Outer-membrane lipoprotein carrier protein n=1 Tax=Legionella birminghamensis TaxID=28083 RepID=A0A378IAS7_9GAMM|nr:outer membrane lipoprotein chaperone LolA [Legionella birminghamensis]KTC73076.1 outer membrane lipoprotein carrier protein [Legionella birminghamensis]STX32347.1 outer membrane lipoprotein carrier protein [Legionella birminghamensis]